MVSIENKEIPPQKNVRVGLTHIFGIGWSTAEKIVNKLGIESKKRIRDLSENEIFSITNEIRHFYTVEGKLKDKRKKNIDEEIRLGTYHGLRRLKKLPVNGQHTRRNARTAKAGAAKLKHGEKRVRKTVANKKKAPTPNWRNITGGGSIINLDKKILADIPLIRGSRNKKRKYAEKIINLAISQEKNLTQYEISLLECIGVESFRNEGVEVFGKVKKSYGSALYLAILSALNKKPISAQVAATGIIASGPKKGKINGSEINLEKETCLPIGGLKEKTSVCI